MVCARVQGTSLCIYTLTYRPDIPILNHLGYPLGPHPCNTSPLLLHQSVVSVWPLHQPHIFGMCCLQGQVQLPPLAHPLPTLTTLFKGSTPLAKRFRKSICQFNFAFAFTSVAAKVNDAVISGSGPYAFKLHGSLHHQMGALLPPPGNQPCYAQLYILDTDMALSARMGNNPNLDPSTMSDHHMLLLECNPYVDMYKQAHQILREKPPGEHLSVVMCIT